MPNAEASYFGRADAVAPPGPAARLAAVRFFPRQPLVVAVAGVAADSELVVAAPRDTERVRVRPYPVACAPGGRNHWAKPSRTVYAPVRLYGVEVFGTERGRPNVGHDAPCPGATTFL